MDGFVLSIDRAALLDDGRSLVYVTIQRSRNNSQRDRPMIARNTEMSSCGRQTVPPTVLTQRWTVCVGDKDSRACLVYSEETRPRWWRHRGSHSAITNSQGRILWSKS